MPLSITATPMPRPVQPFWLAMDDPTVPAVTSKCFCTCRSGDTNFTPGSLAITPTKPAGTFNTCTLGTLSNFFLVVAPLPANKLNKAAVGVLENCTTTVTRFVPLVWGRSLEICPAKAHPAIESARAN